MDECIYKMSDEVQEAWFNPYFTEFDPHAVKVFPLLERLKKEIYNPELIKFAKKELPNCESQEKLREAIEEAIKAKKVADSAKTRAGKKCG